MDRNKWMFEKKNILNVITGKEEEVFSLILERGEDWFLWIIFDKQGDVIFIDSNRAYISDLGAIFLKAQELIREEH